MDQRNSHLEVDYAIGRDIQWNDIGNISGTLQEWCDSCETVLSCIEKQIERANLEKARRTKHKETIEQEVSSDLYFIDLCSVSQHFYVYKYAVLTVELETEPH